MRLLLCAVAVALPLSSQAGNDYTIDSSHTYPHFTISHLGFSTMQGRFDETKGSMTYDKEKKTGSVDITIAAKSVNTGHAKRDKHLRSQDFFNVAEFPSITFKSTKVSLMDSKGTVEGTLTIAGVSKPTTMNVTHIKCGKHPFNKKDVCGFDATAKIKRSDFGLKYGLPAIGDDVNLTFEIEGVKK